MMTQAQDRQIAETLDKLITDLRDTDPKALLVALYGLVESRGDLTEDDLTELSNEIGRLGHMRGRLALQNNPGWVDGAPV